MAEMRINPEPANASVRSAVYSRARTKNRENNPMQSRVDAGSQHFCRAASGAGEEKGPNPNLIPLQVARVDEARQAAINRRVEGVASKAAATG
jgi:hypothetical protein